MQTVTGTIYNGIEYRADDGGGNRIKFILFPHKFHTKDDIQSARKQLQEMLVTKNIRMARPDDWDNLYIEKVFRLCSDLQWYEIHIDRKIIRRERIKGTSIEEYKKSYILPKVEAEKKRNYSKYGFALFQLQIGLQHRQGKLTSWTPNGIEYTEDKTISEGADYLLFPLPHHTSEDIRIAKEWIRNYFRAASLRVAGEEVADSHYIDKVFDHPACYRLRWYEIKVDMELIRAERLKGTPPADYVKNHVLPNIERTRQENIKRHGDRIL
ncbi:hypothetical protein [Olivibacter jilunii]|uniref:hypothetical protein n=1 Tax=Olivibacter jilunii TaxID=985016 RepID=UPI001031ADC0|nr:hypothetical protein [Olivibacter jilunii]